MHVECCQTRLDLRRFKDRSGTQSGIYLAFLAFTAMVAGLAVCLGEAAFGRIPGRLWLSALAAVHTGELLFLIYTWFVPYPAQGYGPWTSLAALEWDLCLSIAVGTTALALALNQSTSHH